ncbi:MAG: septal ring lytic transglycosylase RlpA family protein [Acidobacteriota bacterium]
MPLLTERRWLWASVLAVLALGACTSHRDLSRLSDPAVGQRQVGRASWYGPKFHGRKTASGEVYDMNGVSAAHRELPFGTRLEVRHLGNGRSVEVVINDRGPFVDDRILDLSKGAAKKLDMVAAGVADVEIRILSLPAAAGARYIVQAGAYRDRDNALDLLRRTRSEVPEVEIYTEGVWHRVQVRGLRTRRDARRVRTRLQALGVDALIREAGSGTG